MTIFDVVMFFCGVIAVMAREIYKYRRALRATMDALEEMTTLIANETKRKITLAEDALKTADAINDAKQSKRDVIRYRSIEENPDWVAARAATDAQLAKMGYKPSPTPTERKH